LAALSAGNSAWTLTNDSMTGTDFCTKIINTKMYDGTTDSQAIVHFNWEASRPRTLPSADYDDFSYGYSTYNTQMYMGYNDNTGVTGDNLRFWEGDSATSPTAVDFDVWNQPKNVLTVDGALSGLFSVSASIVAAAGLALSF